MPARPRRCHTRKEWRAPYDLPMRCVNPPLVAGASCRPQARHPPCSRQRVSRATRTMLGRCCIRKVRFEGAAARLHRRAKSATALAATALAATDPTTAAKAATALAASRLSVAAAAQSPVPPPLLPLAAPRLCHTAADTPPPSLPRRRRQAPPPSPPRPEVARVSALGTEPSAPQTSLPRPWSDLSAEPAITEPAAALAAAAQSPALDHHRRARRRKRPPRPHPRSRAPSSIWAPTLT